MGLQADLLLTCGDLVGLRVLVVQNGVQSTGQLLVLLEETEVLLLELVSFESELVGEVGSCDEDSGEESVNERPFLARVEVAEL